MSESEAFPRIVFPMNNGPHPSSGRLGWLFAALLFGVMAGGGIAWALINRHTENPSVVIYQMPTPTPAPSPDDPDRLVQNVRRHRRTVHTAEELPTVLETALANPVASPTATPDLAAGIDGGAATADPSRSGGAEQATPTRETVLVDGIAITQPPKPTVPTPRSSPRAVYDQNSAQVDDSITLALEGINKYIKKGYTIREDCWGGELTAGPNLAKAISHQLFKGNDYWFSMGSATAGATIRVRLYDSDGNPADTNYWQHEASDGSYAAAEIICERTGTYFIVVSAEKSPEERIPWGLVYAYR